MLREMNILIIGGDDRYIEVIRTLTARKANVYLSGYDKLTEKTDGLHIRLEDADFSKFNALLLPVSGTKGDGEIELAPFSSKGLKLTEAMIEKTPEHCTIYTGISNRFLDGLADRTGRKLIRLFERDDIAVLNSIPTAEGTLSLAMNETNTMIHGSNVAVLGFGRVGMTVARIFSAVGAHVSVAARKTSDLARIKEMGLHPVRLDELGGTVSGYEVFINTIPALILDKMALKAIKKSSLIIDLASAPGGVDFNAAEALGINAIHALGLPGKVAPISAGKIIGNVLVDLMIKK